MNRINSIAVFIICTVSVYLPAIDGVVSPPSVSQLHMKCGKHLDKVWVGSGFNKRRGFIVSDVKYDIKITNETVVDYLPAAFNSIGNGDASFNLVVTVVDFSEKIDSVRPYRSNQISVEGRVFNPNKELVAAFQVKRAFPASSGDTKFAIDDIIWAVKKDLLH